MARTGTDPATLRDALVARIAERVGERLDALAAAGVPLSSLGAPDDLAERAAAALPAARHPYDGYGPFYDTTGLTKWLGVSRQALADRVRRGSLLACRTGEGHLVYPAWQFGRDGSLRDGLAPVLRAFAGVDGWAVAAWLTTPAPALRDMSALDWLVVAGDDRAAVVALAARTRSAGGREAARRPGRPGSAAGPGGAARLSRRRVPAGRELFRAHVAGRGPWWFGSDGSGRFDLAAPRGTCYAADSALVAVRERLGPVLGAVPRVPAALLAGAVVTRLPLPAPARLASLRSSRAAGYGVLRELQVMTPYVVPQAWARAFDAAGYGGLSYGPRFTPGRAGAVALFGPAGEADHPVGQAVAAASVPGAPVAIEPPRLAQLGVVRPPRTGPRRRERT